MSIAKPTAPPCNFATNNAEVTHPRKFFRGGTAFEPTGKRLQAAHLSTLRKRPDLQLRTRVHTRQTLGLRHDFPRRRAACARRLLADVQILRSRTNAPTPKSP